NQLKCGSWRRPASSTVNGVRDECGRFPPVCSEPRRGGGRLSYGCARFPCGRQDLRHPRLARPGLRQLDAHAGAADGIRERTAPTFSCPFGAVGEEWERPTFVW